MRRIFFYCHSHQHPTGGQLDTYRHVDMLNALGYDACVVHEAQDYRLRWFENDTPVIDHGEWLRAVDVERDVMVVPEDLGARITRYPGHKVIYDKGFISGSIAAVGNGSGRTPYLDPTVLAILTVSEHNRQHVAYAFPSVPVMVVPPSLNLDRLVCRPLAHKAKRIVTVPKAKASWLTLLHILRARAAQGLNRFDEFDWCVLEKMSERAYLAALQEALVCVFLHEDEGCGRTPLEAMASGCLTVTYDGGPLGDHIPAFCRYRHGDVSGIASFIESVMAEYPSRLDRWQDLAARGRQAVIARFGGDAYRDSVARAWRAIADRLDLITLAATAGGACAGDGLG